MPLLMEEVYRKIKEMIVYGQLTSGEFLTVKDMSDRFSVSKTPVRDALNRLKHEGLIYVIPYKGYVVSSIDLKDLQDLFMLRYLLEGAASKLAALNATEQDVELLEKMATASEIQSENPDKQLMYMKTNFKFHETVATLSKNHRLFKMIVNVMDQMKRELYLDLNAHSPESMIKEHLEIALAIKKRESIKAKRLTIDHIKSSYERILNRNNNQPISY